MKDNGPGIDAATRQRLFEPGVTGKTGGRSLGLGLAICRELARAAGGEISVSSPLTGSTLFRVAAARRRDASPRSRRQRPGKIVVERAASGQHAIELPLPTRRRRRRASSATKSSDFQGRDFSA